MTTVLFWIVCALATAAVAGWMARPFLGARGAAPSRAAHEVAVYKSQLAELERDVARGAIDATEAEAARREIARRLLAADAEAQKTQALPSAPREPARYAAAGAAVVVLTAGFGVYLLTGSPSVPDQPLAGRDIAAEKRATQLTQAQAETMAPPDRAADNPPPGLPENFLELVGRMETILEGRPDDAEGRVVLGRAYLRLERPRAAYPPLQRAAELLGDAAPEELYVDIGRAMVAAAGGYVSREAEDAFRKAPAIGLSQILIGQAEAARGDLEQGLGRWATVYPRLEDPALAAALLGQIRVLAEQMKLDADRIASRLEEARAKAQGLAPGLAQGSEQGPAQGSEQGSDQGAGAPGPSQADIAAAAEMSAEDRAAMITAMVEGLAARLAEAPDDLPGWLRLLRAYQVLGRDDDALEAYRRAREAFEGDAEAEAQLEQALEPALRARLEEDG